ncbi:hypothetical protein GP486_000769 [Trichoglossum hirsutum]|uniref:Small ribosomal subunit protein mS23 n=1 Tax=Trichoglossum hirsutum TaxID=265104 RepID=A0A9P8RTC4_9PEZI|nr:hypothetical protein GP486_000769 [Trichoglossum hirsutum]
MGRYDLRPLRVHQTATQLLQAGRIGAPPPWYDVVAAIPPTQAVVRVLPVEQHDRPSASKAKATKKPSKMFQPQKILHKEDDLRRQFYGDHPWELARPRVVLENDGKDGQRCDWSRISQPGRRLDGESVVQRQLWLTENVSDISPAEAYDQARHEFYALRYQEDVERRVAKEEALATGAHFGKTHLEVGMELEDKMWETWKEWGLKESAAQQQKRASAYTGLEAEEASVADPVIEGVETNRDEPSPVGPLSATPPDTVKTTMELASGPPPQPSTAPSLVGDDLTTPRADQSRSHAQQVPSNPNVNISSSTIRLAPTQPAISAGQVVALAEEAIKTAREETQRSVAGGDAVASGDLKLGVTIDLDLGHKNIARIPDEMVDIIKDEIERRVMAHPLMHFLSTFPQPDHHISRQVCRVFPSALPQHPFQLHPRVSTGSKMLLQATIPRTATNRDSPSVQICQIPFLEILDISRNKLRVLPPEISNLTSLKVLSIHKNRIERLPQCLGDINSLQVLKLDNNPIVFPPREVLEAKELDIPSTATTNERDALFTAHLKRYLKQYVEKPETGESGEESSSDGTAELAEPMRPMKRVASGRFPIKVTSGNNASNDSRSSVLQRPPPVPQRSHARILSQQSSAFRRPGLSALPNGNERLRSNSESILANRANRQKRMGIITRKTSDLGTVDEGRLARLSHYRGLSHGSLMQVNSRSGNGSGGNSSSSPVSPTEVERNKGHYVRRLSSLPEYKRESHSPDAVVEGAKGILYALFQVHPHISNLISVVRDVNSKRSSLERVFYNAATHVDELDRELHIYDTHAEEDEDMLNRTNDGVRRACITCVMAYQHVGMLLQRNVSKIILHGDQRYVRTLLLLVYGSLLEVRNACFSLSTVYRRKMPSNSQDLDGTIRPRATIPKPILAHGGRLRSATTTEALVVPGIGTSNISPVPLSSNSVAGTPRSGEAFQVPSSQPHSRTNTMQGIEDPEEERLFERIFLVLRSATDKALTSLPTISDFFMESALQNKSQEGRTELDQLWTSLNQLCLISMERGRELKTRLSTIKLMEPGIRSQRAFWELCNSFVKSFVDLALRVKEARSMSLIPNEILIILRQVQRLVKECGILIETSPWKYLAAPQYQQPQQPLTVPNLVMQAGFNSGGIVGPVPATSPPSPYVTPLHATPLSAALGPAVQATVPSMPVPQNTYGIFSSTVFDRSDSLLSTPARSLTVGVTDGYNQTAGQGMPSTLLSPIGVRRA